MMRTSNLFPLARRYSKQKVCRKRNNVWTWLSTLSFKKIQSLLLYKKHYTGNKHLFQSFYACKIKKLRHHTFPFFLLSTHNRKEKALSRACHHWWCFALLIGLFVCCIFSQEEKDYSSSSSKWLFLNTSRNSSISSFEFGFIIFTTW